mmetsp:Transcript_23551/g.35787  ORF Transcript_23551/g.35787 Transcript_23551/m.35787 type:complete len:205 (-) Transcript_23551:858-1472(-)
MSRAITFTNLKTVIWSLRRTLNISNARRTRSTSTKARRPLMSPSASGPRYPWTRPALLRASMKTILWTWVTRVQAMSHWWNVSRRLARHTLGSTSLCIQKDRKKFPPRARHPELPQCKRASRRAWAAGMRCRVASCAPPSVLMTWRSSTRRTPRTRSTRVWPSRRHTESSPVAIFTCLHCCRICMSKQLRTSSLTLGGCGAKVI